MYFFYCHNFDAQKNYDIIFYIIICIFKKCEIGQELCSSPWLENFFLKINAKKKLKKSSYIFFFNKSFYIFFLLK